MRSKTVTLYFTPDESITDEQIAEMESLPGARQRNASLISPEAPLEKADFVAGPAVPENYAAAYPRADADTARQRAQAAKAEASGTGTAPAPPAPPTAPQGAGGEPPVDPETLSKAELQAALDKVPGVTYKAADNKAALVALYIEHVQK